MENSVKRSQSLRNARQHLFPMRGSVKIWKGEARVIRKLGDGQWEPQEQSIARSKEWIAMSNVIKRLQKTR